MILKRAGHSKAGTLAEYYLGYSRSSKKIIAAATVGEKIDSNDNGGAKGSR